MDQSTKDRVATYLRAVAASLDEEPISVPEDVLAKAARRMGIGDFITRGSDRLDFKDVSKAGAKDALEAAYRAGYLAGQKKQLLDT